LARFYSPSPNTGQLVRSDKDEKNNLSEARCASEGGCSASEKFPLTPTSKLVGASLFIF